MNIVVRTDSGRYIVRPDTTWEKDNESFYPPEFVRELSYTPVVFARVCKPGRSVGKNFASRYYDLMGYGVLLYPQEMLDGSETGFASASCLDHTSFLPSPEATKEQFFSNSVLTLEMITGDSSSQLFSGNPISPDVIEQAVAEATRFIYIRTGDFIAIELAPRKPLCTSEDGTVKILGKWDGTGSIDFDIVF